MKKQDIFTQKAFFKGFSIVRSLITIAAFLIGIAALAKPLTEFQKVRIMTGLKNPVNFEFAPDGRIFVLDRFGEVLVYKPDSQTSVSAGTLEVFHNLEEGLLAIAFDPDFLTNQYVYIHYSPSSASVNRVSRFTMEGDQLNFSSEKVIIEWQTQRDGGYHAAGDMDFDSRGNLYIATGDNSQHSLYTTLDETDPLKSSENTSSNSNDLRGKILRIKPEPDGTYSIPEGNLYPDGVGGRAEIYVMGARNPFKIFVDKNNTDWLFWSDVGPDANNKSRLGPVGMDEINLTKKAGNFGWPYFSGKNEPYLNTYKDPEFYYDPNNPVNFSKWNTGAKNLPPAEPSWQEFFHQCYLAGPRYYFDPALDNPRKLPAKYDGAFFYFDFNTSQVWATKMDEEGNILSTEQLAPHVVKGAGFIEAKIGPDGQLYLLEYGAGCCPDNTGTGRLVRIDYTGVDPNQTAEVNVKADRTSGSLPLTVNFSSEGTVDPDGDQLSYEWDFQGDGVIDSREENPFFTFTTEGVYDVRLQVNDSKGGVNSKSVRIHAGNNAPTFNFIYPPDGGMISWEDNLPYHLEINDQEDGSTADGSIDCSKLSLVPSLGHLDHFHDELSIKECEGTFFIDPKGHDTEGEHDIFLVFNVSYTDAHGLTSFDQIRLHPKIMEAEFYDQEYQTYKIDNTDPLGGGNYSVRALSDGAYLMFEARNLLNIQAVSYRIASTSGGTIEIRSGSADGALLSSVEVPVTGSPDKWATIEAPVTDPGGKHDLYLVFKSKAGDTNLFDINYIEFKGSGVSVDNTPPAVSSLQVLSSSQIIVKFNEALEKNSAEKTANFTINHEVSISSAALQGDGRSVLLKTSPLSAQQPYELTVRNIQNEKGNILPQPVSKNFTFIVAPIRINSGGGKFKTQSEAAFSRDHYHTGSSDSYQNEVSIAGTEDDLLYQSGRTGTFSYELPVAPGAYQLRLHFAETDYTTPGQRVFSVMAEGNPVLTDYDIVADAGASTAVVKEAQILVTDEVLNLSFSASVDEALVSGIEVIYTPESTPEPSLRILNPISGSTVVQPFNLHFEVKNWILEEEGSHIHVVVDGLDKGEVFSGDPISFHDLSVGTHSIQLVLVNKNHTPTKYSSQRQLKVVEELDCPDNPFPTEWAEVVIGSEVPYRSVYIFSEDLDGDGYKDIVTGGWWYKNPGKPDGNWDRREIGAPLYNMSLIHDLDGDGDWDIFGTQGRNIGSEMAWAENDGRGNFTVHTNIPAGTSTYPENFMAGAAIGNFNGVANTQIAVIWNGGEDEHSDVQMLTVPADPVNEEWTITSISPDSYGEAISAGDIDGDGDLDLFQGAIWLRNEGDSWTTFSTGISLPTKIDRSTLTDLNGDGILDGVVNQIGNGQNVSWFVPSANPTEPWTSQIIGKKVDGGLSLDVADIDFDGDLDVIVGEWQGAQRLLAFENDLCNSGSWIQHVLHPGGTADHHDGSQAVDIDNDGDLDLISIGWNTRIPRIYVNNSNNFNENPPPMVANPMPDQKGIEGVPFQFTFTENTFSDPDGDDLSYRASLSDENPLPSWLVFDEATRTFSGTPAISEVGVYDIRVTATDSKGAFVQDVFSLTVRSAETASNLRLNSGGSPLTVTSGESFSADEYYSGTSKVNGKALDIANTEDDTLYQSERWGNNFSYHIPIPSGTYQLRLHFAELNWTSPGKRIFSVSVEDNAMLTDFDIVADAGPATAVVKEMEVTVTDGLLTIDFAASADYAKVAAIEIAPPAPDTVVNAVSASLSDVLVVYPNPFHNILNLKIENDYTGEVNLLLYDLQGNRLMEKTFQKVAQKHKQQLPLKYIFLPQGTYFLKVSMRGLNDQLIKFIKE